MQNDMYISEELSDEDFDALMSSLVNEITVEPPIDFSGKVMVRLTPSAPASQSDPFLLYLLAGIIVISGLVLAAWYALPDGWSNNLASKVSLNIEPSSWFSSSLPVAAATVLMGLLFVIIDHLLFKRFRRGGSLSLT